MNASKIGGLVISTGSIVVGIYTRDWQLFQVTLALGLMMLFFTKERVSDERVEQLKMRALFLAMSAGLGFAVITQYYLHLIIPGLRAHPGDAHQPLSVYEFLSAVFLLALGLFHYWRWKDGQPQEME